MPVVLAVLAAGGEAQVVPGGPGSDIARGTSFYEFAPQGAITFDVYVIGEGVRNGIYRLQEGTTLMQLVALIGGTPTSAVTDREVRTATIRLFRTEGSTRRLIYEATPEELVRNPEQHPALQEGDVLETDVTLEEVKEPFTLQQGLQIASSVASFVSVVLLIIYRTRR